MSIEGRVLGSVAVPHAILTDEQTQRGSMLVDIGGQITQVVAFYEGAPVQFLCVPIGGVHVTNDIAVGMKIPFEEAERIKQRSAFHGENDKDKDEFIQEIMGARLQEIMELIESETREVRNNGLVPCGVFFAGAGSFTPGALEQASEIFDLPAQMGKAHPINVPKGIEPCNLSQVAVGIVRYVGAYSRFFLARASQPSTFRRALFGFREWIDEFLKDFF